MYTLCIMAHKQIHSSKTIRYKGENMRHKDAIPYQRTVKHRTSFLYSD